MPHKACHSDWVSRMGLVTRGYLTLPVFIAGPVDPDVRSILASKGCKAIRVMEFAIAASKDIWQPEPEATIMVYEKYW